MKPAHIEEFDGLRAIAVMAVMAAHFMGGALPSFGFGAFGVQMFFVLSGFLITGILLEGTERIRSNSSSVGQEMRTFYIRRFLRIFPVYYLVVFVAALIGIAAVRDYLGWHVLYATNFLVVELQHFPDPAGVFWTLAVEEQFYLLWPAVVLLVPRRAFVPLVVALILSAIVFRGATALLTPIKYGTLLPANLDSLCGGALLAALHQKNANLKQIAVILTALAIAAAIFLPQKQLDEANVTLLSSQSRLAMVLYGMTAVHFAATWTGAKALAFLRLAPLTYVGKISYGVYLYHLFVSHFFNMAGLSMSVLAGFVIKSGLTILVATVSWFAFERPINNLKKRFPYRRPNPPITNEPLPVA